MCFKLLIKEINDDPEEEVDDPVGIPFHDFADKIRSQYASVCEQLACALLKKQFLQV